MQRSSLGLVPNKACKRGNKLRAIMQRRADTIHLHAESPCRSSSCTTSSFSVTWYRDDCLVGLAGAGEAAACGDGCSERGAF